MDRTSCTVTLFVMANSDAMAGRHGATMEEDTGAMSENSEMVKVAPHFFFMLQFCGLAWSCGPSHVTFEGIESRGGSATQAAALGVKWPASRWCNATSAAFNVMAMRARCARGSSLQGVVTEGGSILQKRVCLETDVCKTQH